MVCPRNRRQNSKRVEERSGIDVSNTTVHVEFFCSIGGFVTIIDRGAKGNSKEKLSNLDGV